LEEAQTSNLESQTNTTTIDVTSLNQKVINLENVQNSTRQILANVNSAALLQLCSFSPSNFMMPQLPSSTSNPPLNQVNLIANLSGHSIQPLPSSSMPNSLLSAFVPNSISPINRKI
jgi:hypothetical protein